jgi:tRNA-Thr(GGU) m(6)t(6)A37 methyltransferase TsaA
MDPITVTPVATVVGGRVEATDDRWLSVEASIVLDDRFPEDALQGLDAFSHLEVVFVFHQVDEAGVTVGARHPRGQQHLPAVGIFAQRARNRPNRLGVSVCELVAVDGRTLRVRGLDAIDGTPVLDLKPVITTMRPPGEVREPAWVAEIMSDYW